MKMVLRRYRHANFTKFNTAHRLISLSDRTFRERMSTRHRIHHRVKLTRYLCRQIGKGFKSNSTI